MGRNYPGFNNLELIGGSINKDTNLILNFSHRLNLLTHREHELPNANIESLINKNVLMNIEDKSQLLYSPLIRINNYLKSPITYPFNLNGPNKTLIKYVLKRLPINTAEAHKCFYSSKVLAIWE